MEGALPEMLHCLNTENYFNGCFQGLIGGGESMLVMKPDPGLENGWPDLGSFSSGFGCPLEAKAKDSLNMCPAVGKERKPQSTKVGAEDEFKDRKKLKGSSEDGESKITTEQTSNNSGRETSADNSVQNQKPDYIHVRARRGQATDSHSLAERVRREKISERMKYLQDLVPGCNKITGKAGMLDEIINYVQSLQRQVEFLSMKLATVNPRMELNMDNVLAKEMFSTNFPTIGIGMSSEMGNPAYLQQVMGMNSSEMALRRTPVEPFLDSSCFTPSSSWDWDLQNLYNIDFHQPPSNLITHLQGLNASNLKMEM